MISWTYLSSHGLQPDVGQPGDSCPIPRSGCPVSTSTDGQKQRRVGAFFWPEKVGGSWGIRIRTPIKKPPNSNQSNQSKQRFHEIPWDSEIFFVIERLMTNLIDWLTFSLIGQLTEELKPWQHSWVVLPRRACRRSRNCGWRLSKRPGGYAVHSWWLPWDIHDLVDRRPLRKTPGWNCWGAPPSCWNARACAGDSNPQRSIRIRVKFEPYPLEPWKPLNLACNGQVAFRSRAFTSSFFIQM